MQSNSWLTRDGRKCDSSNNEKIDKLFEEHLKQLEKKKGQNLELLNKITFSISIVNPSTGEISPFNFQNPTVSQFSKFKGLPQQLGKNLERLKFEEITPIQRTVIPFIQNKKDIVACSETGSGKTVAYLFPIIGNMLVKGVPNNPYASSDSNQNFKTLKCYPLTLVLLPTRELAEQVYLEALKLTYNTGILPVKVYGGEDKMTQIRELEKGCDILIATPGRLTDLLKRGKVSLSMISQIVLDEGDRMLDMGFLPQLEDIYNNYDLVGKDKRQTFLFSATFSKEVEGIANRFLNSYYYITPNNVAPKQVKHEFLQFNLDNKLDQLLNILSKEKGPLMIFVATKRGVEELAFQLQSKGIQCCFLHGDKKQNERQYNIDQFKTEKVNILIATDVAGRGLDFPNVSTVINYDIPQNIEDYIHRTGRTGRIGKTGLAISFIGNRDGSMVEKLKVFLSQLGQNIPEWFDEINSMGHYSNYKRNNNFNSFGQSNNFNQEDRKNNWNFSSNENNNWKKKEEKENNNWDNNWGSQKDNNNNNCNTQENSYGSSRNESNKKNNSNSNNWWNSEKDDDSSKNKERERSRDKNEWKW